jgi:enoyl-CoA hydratase/carnithine racemase
MPIPVVAAIDGHAVAGGCVLALQTDFRIMSAGTIGLNEVRIGVGLPAVVLETLRLQVSAPALRTIALEGRLFEPEAAREIGLVDEVVAPDRLIARRTSRSRCARPLRKRPVAAPPRTARYGRPDSLLGRRRRSCGKWSTGCARSADERRPATWWRYRRGAVASGFSFSQVERSASVSVRADSAALTSAGVGAASTSST